MIKLISVKCKEKSQWEGFYQLGSHPEEETKNQTYEE